MVLLKLLISIAALLSAIHAKANKLDGAVGNSYIIEFEPQEADTVSVVHAEFHQHLTQRSNRGYNTRFEWNNPDVMVGMSVQLNDDNDRHLLAAGPGVKNVYPNRVVPRPATFVRSQIAKDARLQRRDEATPSEMDFLRLKDNFPSHVLTGVDKLHTLQMYGAGQTVAIVDDGISHHPALDARYGDNKGWAFVGDEFNANNASTMQLSPGPDPYSKCADHGTHLAGIVAANDTRLGFTGVVPQASLRAYRIAGCHGPTTSDLIVAGLERAYADGNDVISLSWNTGIDAELSPGSIWGSSNHVKRHPCRTGGRKPGVSRHVWRRRRGSRSNKCWNSLQSDSARLYYTGGRYDEDPAEDRALLHSLLDEVEFNLYF